MKYTEENSNNPIIEKNVFDRPIPNIYHSISTDYIDNFQPVHKRYFEEKYATQFSTNEKNLDTCIRLHSNKICVIYLSEKHAVMHNKSKIQTLNFQISPKINRLTNVMTGKGKRGAQFLTPDSILCIVEMEDGNKYQIYAGIKGKLLEINSQIVDNPQLIIDDHLSKGFIAVVLLDLKKFDDTMNLLKNKEEYFAAI